MRIIILILCCVCGSYGNNGTERPKRTEIVTFNVSVIREKARCRSSQQELTLEEGSTVILNASARIPLPNGNDHIEIMKCTFNNGTGNDYTLGDEYYGSQTNYAEWKEEQIVKKHMFGTWTCKLQYNEDCKNGEIKPVEENRSYSYVLCNITVNKLDVFVPTTTSVPLKMPVDKAETWYIVGGVGTLVMLVIIGQAIALCYFRRKAQPRRRMDNMTTRSRSDRGDRARYSAPPCKKGKSSARAQADTDSHIYEMVGVNALYNKSSDLDPANTATAERNIRDRPPLPLPHEIPKPVLLSANETLPRHKPAPMTSMPSTLSLNSTSSGSNLISKKKGKELPPPPVQGFKKAPARPPKQVDEDSMPTSLSRPALPLPAPAPAAAPAPASVKTLPKKPSTESPMSELKNIFKKRNAGKDKSTSSPAATLERKEPPKVQAKPSTLTKAPKKQPPDATTIPVPHPTAVVKPIKQTNQIKLILPKIEASLKAPKPLIPKPVEPTTSPIKSPPTPMKKPSQLTQKQKPLPVTNLPPMPVQKRPLPTPETSRKLLPEPISPTPVPPPLYQASHEGQSPNTDDEEEWTYEQLGEYNIYNI